MYKAIYNLILWELPDHRYDQINVIKDEQIEDNKLKKQIVLEHYNKILNYYGERNGIKIARKHICWYSKTIKNGAEFRKHFNVINDLDIAKNMIKEFF